MTISLGMRPGPLAPDHETVTEMPELANHERERKPKRKPPEGPRGRATAARVTQETRVSLESRIQKFADQGLKASAGKLFCQACPCEVPNIWSSIVNHLNTKKHKDRLW